jgi:hypothetical protein
MKNWTPLVLFGWTIMALDIVMTHGASRLHQRSWFPTTDAECIEDFLSLLVFAVAGGMVYVGNALNRNLPKPVPPKEKK